MILTKLNKEGSELSEKIGQLKMESPDSKMRMTDVAKIAEAELAKGVQQNATAGKKGGRIAKNARLALEQKTGRKVITGENFLPPAKEKKTIGK